MIKALTIPSELLKEESLVIIPRSEYEEFLDLKKTFKLVEATISEKKAIRNGRVQIKKGDYLNLKQLKHELGC